MNGPHIDDSRNLINEIFKDLIQTGGEQDVFDNPYFTDRTNQNMIKINENTYKTNQTCKLTNKQKSQKERTKKIINASVLSPTKVFNDKLKLINKIFQTKLVHKAAEKFKSLSRFFKMKKLNELHYNLLNDQMLRENVNPEKRIFSKKTNLIIESLKSYLLNKIQRVRLFRPNHKYKLVWDLMIIFITIVQIIKISLELSFSVDFESKSYFYFFNYFVLVVFALNIIVTLNTTIFKDGSAIIDRRLILENYFQENFVIDVISITCATFDFSDFDVSKIFLFLFFINLKRISNLLKTFKETFEIPDSIALLMITIKSLSLAHFIACIWHSIGYYDFSNSQKNWIMVNGYQNSFWYEKYFASLYWAIITLTTVGYGDITPQNMIEKIFCSLVCMIGTLMFGYGINSIGIIIQSIEEKGKELKDNIRIIDNFMKKKNIDVDLKTRVKKSMEHMWKMDQKNIEKEQSIIDNLPFLLRKEVLLGTNAILLKQVGILSKNFSNEFLEKLALEIQPSSFIPDEKIYKDGESDDYSLHLIIEGSVDLICESKSKKKKGVVLKNLKSGSHFGEGSFFSNSAYHETAKSSSFTSLFRIKRSLFLRVLLNFPNDMERFHMIQQSLHFYYDNCNLSSLCYSCFSSNHTYRTCPLLTYIPNKSSIIFKKNYSRSQERNSFPRKKRRINALCSKKKNIKSIFEIKFNKTFSGFFGLTDDEETSTFNDEEEYDEGAEYSSKRRTNSAESHFISLPLHLLDNEGQRHEISKSIVRSSSLIENSLSDKKSKKTLFFPQEQMKSFFNGENQTENALSPLNDPFFKNIETDKRGSFQFSYQVSRKSIGLNGEKSINQKHNSRKSIRPTEVINYTPHEEKNGNYRKSIRPTDEIRSLSPYEEKNGNHSLLTDQICKEEKESPNNSKEIYSNNKFFPTRKSSHIGVKISSNTSSTKSYVKQNSKANRSQAERENTNREVMSSRFSAKINNGLFWYDFEKMKNYKHYMTHNNSSEILNKIKKRRKTKTKTMTKIKENYASK